MTKRYPRYVLISVIFVNSIAFIAGCAKREGAKASWVSVTKPPIQIVYVSREIPPSAVTGIIKQVEAYPYENYKFNDVTEVKLVMEGSNVHTTTNTSSATLEIKK